MIKKTSCSRFIFTSIQAWLIVLVPPHALFSPNSNQEINGLKDQLTASEIEIEKLKGEIDDYANERLEETRLREDLEDKIAAQGDELRVSLIVPTSNLLSRKR